MISVIIPVYNVKPYLRRCLDSVVGQTYRDLEIIVVDDGSTDGSGQVCDEYKRDERVRVFHTENRGLSASRNLGINEASGEWIGFVDSDDWIESNMYEKAIADIGSADILCFCKNEGTYSGFEALVELINGRISNFSWDKLYRRECFSSIRFPEGRIMEDIATTYMLLYQAGQVTCSDIHGYHHIFRIDSLCQTHNMKNLVDYYLSMTEQYEYCSKIIEDSTNDLSNKKKDEIYVKLLEGRAYAIARAWGWRSINSSSESPVWEKMHNEARTLFPYRIRKQFPFRIRGGIFLASFNHPLSFWLAHKIHIITRKVPYEK